MAEMALRHQHEECQWGRSLRALRGSCDLASPVHFPARNASFPLLRLDLVLFSFQ